MTDTEKIDDRAAREVRPVVDEDRTIQVGTETVAYIPTEHERIEHR